jgi:hypothetical protein
VAAYGVPDALDRLKEHLDPLWIEEALTWSGATSIRRRRLPADQVVWLVIGMALYRNEPIEYIVAMLGLARRIGKTRWSLRARSLRRVSD